LVSLKRERGRKQEDTRKKRTKALGGLRATESVGGVVLDAGVFKESNPRSQTQWIY
jgi:hypothetical protein